MMKSSKRMRTLLRISSLDTLGLVLALHLMTTVSLVAANANDYAEAKPKSFSEARDRISESKLWFLREINIAGYTIPVSPVTLLTVLLVLLTIAANWGTYAWCEASHILLKNHGKETQEEMIMIKKEIGNDAANFAKVAKEISMCPSARKGGSLGVFYRGDMAKNFDRACFDPKVPMNECVGPVQTSFGWHLIFIHDRKI